MLSIRILRLVVAIYFSRIRSRGLRRDLHREVRAGEPHISGQGVKLVFVCDVGYRVVFLKLAFNSKLLSAAFEL